MRVLIGTAFLLAFAASASAGEITTVEKVIITPAAPVTTGDARATAAATVLPQAGTSGEVRQSVPAYSDLGGYKGCERGHTTALIN